MNIKKNENKKENIFNNYNDFNNKSFKSSLNVFKDRDNFYNSINENKLSILNKNNVNISKGNVNNNILEDEKTKKCVIF